MIGVVMATRMEAEGLIGLLGLHPTAEEPFPIFEGQDLVLILSGIGKANAAMATTYVIARYPLRCVCNLGAAGATGTGLAVGACVHVGRVIEPDRPDVNGVPHTHTLAPLPGFATVSLATQDRAVLDNTERGQLATQAAIVDMEGAAVTQVCHRLSIPGYVFKFISDTPEHPDLVHILGNILSHRDALARFFIREVRPRLA